MGKFEVLQLSEPPTAAAYSRMEQIGVKCLKRDKQLRTSRLVAHSHSPTTRRLATVMKAITGIPEQMIL
jgi:hypothetical protein